MDLVCGLDDCGARLLALSTEAETVNRARAGGWHVWTGETVGGACKTVVLCPTHSRGHRAGPAQPIEGEQTLF